MNLKLKITLAFLLVGLLPFGVFALFTIHSVSASIKERVQENLILSTNILLHEIVEDLHNMDSLIEQWAKLQIMDDILVNDVDKRISEFLSRVLGSLKFEGYILCTNNEGKIVAASEAELIGERFTVENRDEKLVEFRGQKFIVLGKTVYASFSPEMVIGDIYVLFSLRNIERILPNSDVQFASFINRELGIEINPRLKGVKLDPEFIGFKELGDFFVFFQPFEDSLLGKGWFIVSGVRSQTVFEPVREIILMFGGYALFGALLIIFSSLALSSRILKPVEELSSAMEYIVNTKDYTKRVSVRGEDELAKVSVSFNHMLAEVERALREIEQENIKRLKLFKKLVEMFAFILNQEDEETLLKTAVEQLREFLGVNVALLPEPQAGWRSYRIEAQIFKGSSLERKTVGYISLSLEETSSELEDFLTSVAKLLSFQIERLNMLKAQSFLRQKAEESSRAKSLFIANMSHELRTPLNAIIGFAQFLQTEEGIADSDKEILKNIETAGRHLLSIINDILDFSKAEAGKLKVKAERVNLKELLQEVEIIIKPSAEEKGLRLELEKPEIYLETDPRVLKQILINLLSNAVKYTEDGRVSLKIEKLSDRLRFRVIDTGIGISKENQRRLFQVFEQIENPMQKKYKGTGLGLALTKKLVEALGGKIGVHSEGEGKGSEFWFEIPI